MFDEDRNTLPLTQLPHTRTQAPASLRSPLRNSTVTLFEVTSPFARYHLYAPLLHHFSRVREERRLDIRVVIESPDLVRRRSTPQQAPLSVYERDQ